MNLVSRRQASRILAGSVIALLGAHPVQAAIGTWTGGTTGIWDTTNTNWTVVGNPAWDTVNGPANTALFNTAGATAAVSGSLVAGNIVFSQTATVRSASGSTANAISFGSNGAALTVQVDPGVTGTIGAPITVFGSPATDQSNSLAKTGAGDLILGGTVRLATDTDNNKSSFFTINGGGSVDVTGSLISTTVTGGTSRQAPTSFVGNTSGNNTLRVSGTGRLWTNDFTLGGAGFNNNSVVLSSAGNAAAPTWTIYGDAPQLNLVSSGNSVSVQNGAYFTMNGSTGTGTWSLGASAGNNSNSILVDGLGSTVRRNASNFINVGVAGDGNSYTVQNGGTAVGGRIGVGTGGGDNNFELITGAGSTLTANLGTNNNFQVGSGAGSNNNAFRVEAGGVVKVSGGTATNRQASIGEVATANGNFVRVTGAGSQLHLVLATSGGGIPLVIGGAQSLGTSVVSGGDGNHIDIFSGGLLNLENSSGSISSLTASGSMGMVLSGTNSALNLGDGNAISAVRTGKSGATFVGIALSSADSRLNFNSGRLIAGQDGSLVSGAGQVQLNGPAYVSTTFGGSVISAVIAGGSGNNLIKEGSGTLTLSGANTYTGATVVNAGTLALDHTVPGSKLAAGSTLVLGGGTLDLKSGTSTDVVASMSLNGGGSNITRSSGTSIVRVNGITPGVGIVNFGGNSIASTTNTNINGILGAWATVGGVDWAMNSGVDDGGGAGNNFITAFTGYTPYDALGSVLADAAADNARLDTAGGSGNITLGAPTTTINTLLQITAGAATVETAGAVLATNGIMIGTGAEAVTIGVAAGDGSLQTATAGANLVLNNNNTGGLVDLTINAPIVANGASGLATAGRVFLNGVNTYTGATGVGGALTIGGAGQLNGGSYAGAIGISGAGTLIMNTAANQTLGGVISGDGAVTQSGAGTTTLTGANTYTGVTTVGGGILKAGHATAFGSASTAALALSGAGTIQLNGNNITVTALNSASGFAVVESASGVAGTDTLTVNTGRTVTAGFADSSYAGILQDGSTRKLALVKSGLAGLILSGSSTYSGGTTVEAGSLTLANQNGLGTGTLTLANGAVFQTLFAGDTSGGALPNVINLSGGQTFFNIPDTSGFQAIWLDQNVSGLGAIRLVSSATVVSTPRTLTLSGAKTFSGGILQTSGSLVTIDSAGNAAAGSGQYPSVAIDHVASLGAGTFRAQINGSSTASGVLRTLTDLSAGTGVANAFEIAASSRLVTEVAGSNHLKLSGVISGTGNLIKTGSATLTLSGSNTYTGSTTLTSGTVSVGADANLGGANAVVFNGGTLQVTGTTMNSLGIHTQSFVATKQPIFDIADVANIFTVSQVVASTTGGLTKTGAGTLAITANNTGSYTGQTRANGGVLLLNNATAVPGGIATAGGTSRIEFNGGVIGLGVGDFTRNLGNTTTDATFVGAGGWAAYTADRTVNLGGAGVTIDWSAIDGSGFNDQTLILGAATADKTVTLVNPLTFNAALETLQVDNGSAADDAILSGGIFAFAGQGITKTGDGSVQLNGTQEYDVLNATAGTTNVNGALGTAPGLAAVTVSPGAKLKFGTVSQNLASLTIGAGGTVTFTSGTATGAFSGGGGKAGGFGTAASSFGGGVAVVPEPGTLGLLLIGALGVLQRRRRVA